MTTNVKIKPRQARVVEPEYFRTGIRIKKDVWDKLTVACSALGIKKGKLLEDLAEEWLEKNQSKVKWHLNDKILAKEHTDE